MQNLLTQFALRDVWCDPYQDKQTVIRLARITKKGGGFKTAPVIRQQINLPNFSDFSDRSTYHLYQIGQLPPHLFNMLTIPEDSLTVGVVNTVSDGYVTTPGVSSIKSLVTVRTGQWYRVAQLCASNAAVVDVYTANGARLPRHECWLQRMADRNFILAVRVMPNYYLGEKNYTDVYSGITSRIRRTLDNESLYIRFYSNSLFDTQNWRSNAPSADLPIRTLVTTVASMADWLVHSQSADAIETVFGGVGAAIWQTDGYVTHRPIGYSAAMLGRTYSYMWDASIKSVTYFPLSQLPIFTSSVDAGKKKYAIIQNTPYASIDYYDDMDFYLIRRYSASSYTGVYIGKTRHVNVRQLTHNAYALRKDTVDELIAGDSLFSTGTLEIMVVTRQGGIVRGIQQQHTRIEELSRLTYPQIVEAMTSALNTTVPEWGVVQLESSDYAKVMGKSIERITDDMVENMFGYNTATRLVANPICPVQALGGDPVIVAPLAACIAEADGTSAHRVVFCYDVSGDYRGYFVGRGNYSTIAIKAPFKTTAVLTECFNMRPSVNDLSLHFDQDVQLMDLSHWGFRCYVCPIVGGIPNEQWEDVTGSIYYTYNTDVTPPRIEWNTAVLDLNNLYGCVRIGGHMQIVTLPTLPVPYDGYMYFDVESELDWLGSTVTKPQTIPNGTIDVFMDGKTLHQDLDFYVEWPRVVIVKRPTTLPANTVIQYRTYGFADAATMRPHVPRELNFVRGGILSVNQNYDIRNDRNLHVLVGGQLKAREAVSFSETDTVHRMTDGKPYSVADYVLSVEPFTTRSTNEYRLASVDMDNRVSDYLETRLPTWHPTFPIVEIQRWDVVSPFCSGLIHAILNGALTVLDVIYTDVQIHDMVLPWLWLLPYDPCVRGIDSNYVYVHAHQLAESVTLTVGQYRFIERVIVLYLNNLPDLTPSAVIGG